MIRRLLRRRGLEETGAAPTVDRATIFVADRDDHPSDDYAWVEGWLRRRGAHVAVRGYSTGGYEHVWDVEGTQEALSEIPEDFLCHSASVERTQAGWAEAESRLELKFRPPRR